MGRNDQLIKKFKDMCYEKSLEEIKAMYLELEDISRTDLLLSDDYGPFRVAFKTVNIDLLNWLCTLLSKKTLQKVIGFCLEASVNSLYSDENERIKIMEWAWEKLTDEYIKTDCLRKISGCSASFFKYSDLRPTTFKLISWTLNHLPTKNKIEHLTALIKQQIENTGYENYHVCNLVKMLPEYSNEIKSIYADLWNCPR